MWTGVCSSFSQSEWWQCFFWTGLVTPSLRKVWWAVYCCDMIFDWPRSCNEKDHKLWKYHPPNHWFQTYHCCGALSQWHHCLAPRCHHLELGQISCDSRWLCLGLPIKPLGTSHGTSLVSFPWCPRYCSTQFGNQCFKWCWRNCQEWGQTGMNKLHLRVSVRAPQISPFSWKIFRWKKVQCCCNY